MNSRTEMHCDWLEKLYCVVNYQDVNLDVTLLKKKLCQYQTLALSQDFLIKLDNFTRKKNSPMNAKV